MLNIRFPSSSALFCVAVLLLLACSCFINVSLRTQFLLQKIICPDQYASSLAVWRILHGICQFHDRNTKLLAPCVLFRLHSAVGMSEKLPHHYGASVKFSDSFRCRAVNINVALSEWCLKIGNLIIIPPGLIYLYIHIQCHYRCECGTCSLK